MFLTITIDTSEKKKNLIQMKKKKINAKRGWKKPSNVKKLNFIARLKVWRKSFRVGYYKLGKQIAMI